MAKFKYTSQNHNWDLTLLASADLLKLAIQQKTDKRLIFACLSGAMLLAVAALESYLNSLASLIPEAVFQKAEFERKSIEDKLEQIYKKYSIEIKKGERPLQTIGLAISWRNSLVHSKPDFVEETEISSMDEVRTLSPKKSYEFFVKEEFARHFYVDILQVIQNLIEISKIKPSAQCGYTRIS